MINQQRGFTVIEVLVAVLIAAVGMTLFTGAAISVARSNRHAAALTQSTLIAEEKLAYLHQIGFANIDPKGYSGTKLIDGVEYSWSIKPTEKQPGVAYMHCEVSWGSGPQQQKKIFQTYVTRQQ